MGRRHQPKPEVELPPLRDQIEGALDPKGEFRQLSTAFGLMTGNVIGRGLLRLAGVDVQAVRDAAEGAPRLLAQAEAIIAALVPLGWAVSQSLPVDDLARAVEALAAEGESALDQVLVEIMSDDFWLRRPAVRVGALGQDDAEYQAYFAQRRRLLLKAVEHHLAGRYDASVPIIMAQIDGLTADVTGGKQFFNKGGKKADVVDPALLAAVPGHLDRLRDLFSKDASLTVTDTSISRHGVLHGRHLGYDNEVNSLKMFALLEAVVDWAGPRANEEGSARRAARQAHHSGSSELGPNGERLDDREFRETRQALRNLMGVQLGWYRRLGHFREDALDVAFGFGNLSAGLPLPNDIEMAVAADKQVFWAWRQTPSAWHLGLAARATHPEHRDGVGFQEWLWDSPESPVAGPEQDPAWATRSTRPRTGAERHRRA